MLYQIFDWKPLSTDHPAPLSPTPMTITDILTMDHLDYDSFGHFIEFTGTVIFSGNASYPAFDLREDGFLTDDYDLEIGGADYNAFNTLMADYVGQEVTIEGYLVGFDYIDQPFNWFVRVTKVTPALGE